MSNINLIIEERPSIVGNFMVGRLLPFKDKRMVGPFAFIDHMGPATFGNQENYDVGAHPHIGLSTLTFLFEGSIMHRDSLGTKIEIVPNQVNWMTAGKGITHSERTPEHLLDKEKKMHGLQIWVALPKELEQMEPSFTHIEENGIPSWKDGDLSYKLIAGEAFGKKSDVPVYSPLYFIEIKSKTKQLIDIGSQLYGESALYILEGSISNGENTYQPKHILIANDATLCSFTINENSTVYIFGGIPFPEPRTIYWNFVATDKQLIEDAKKRWINHEFPKVPDEYEYIPLPDQLSNFRPK